MTTLARPEPGLLAPEHGHASPPSSQADYRAMASPAELLRSLPAGPRASASVHSGREAVKRVLSGADPRWLVVVGPCSIHDPRAGLDYAARLADLASELDDTLLIVMRAYFEKPRTSVGWKGLINDPYMDDSYCVDEGMHIARRFLLAAAELGLPLAGEALDPMSPLYLADLYSWMAIGARTTESQIHRELASALDSAVGFKNSTDGSLDAALNAIVSASAPHAYLGMGKDGRVAVVNSRGNPHCHLVLRGGGGRPNYDSVSIALAEQAMKKHDIPPAIMVDCAHANSWKQHTLQPRVLADAVSQIRHGNRSIRAFMLESFIEAGNQSIPADLSQLRYGCSVTDPCVDWHTTADILRDARAKLRPLLES
ncbi:3-deoxy-7-phosphoheptulonate synthase [Chromobacterium violaceum]|uniref:3-deoxy-7-phosphoheptulonate synthase n=1 Tax=Chromobacterium violaceum TaxID=536 RepID=UPI000C127B67|nr:3-deoxy-7-phosphoheptulonate synthase [Chromobacterium violaceum]ATP28124.1 3-deoxy-7-phosphoheptulonate synthase [Chromobacterium violaceum]ATP32032.1 3-deoxy-7-phosphoheptulonate synthase [Chromobacterium violaceum]